MTAKKYAVLGDIHGNLEGLLAVLRDADEQGATDFACVGDVVGYNADPHACIEHLRTRTCITVRGNHDQYCSSNESLSSFHPVAAAAIRWTRGQLSEDEQAWLRDLRFVRVLPEFTLVHSTLDMPDRWRYVFESLDAQAHFSYQTTPVCFYGHTHVPIAFQNQRGVSGGPYTKLAIESGRRYFINVGSVGQPRDGNPDSAYVLYDLAERTVSLRRIPYELHRAQEKIIDAGLPSQLALRLRLGR